MQQLGLRQELVDVTRLGLRAHTFERVRGLPVAVGAGGAQDQNPHSNFSQQKNALLASSSVEEKAPKSMI